MMKNRRWSYNVGRKYFVHHKACSDPAWPGNACNRSSTFAKAGPTANPSGGGGGGDDDDDDDDLKDFFIRRKIQEPKLSTHSFQFVNGVKVNVE
jgi:hypothetical protein